MVRHLLVVDDDQEVLLTLKEGLEKINDSFVVSIAGDGMIATQKLKTEPISLVVTDLKMPLMDGFQLLAHIIENYPDIPVIATTGYSTPAMKKMAQESGAIGYLAKPFRIENLARLILNAFNQEAEGGRLHNVSSGMFLQLMEFEQKTCTIRMVDQETGKMGVLFFRNGELLDARCEGLQGIEAAYKIFSWDEVALEIQNNCPQKVCVINRDLQPIILEAMRRKDEALEDMQTIEGIPVIEAADLIEIEDDLDYGPLDRRTRIEGKVTSLLGRNGGVDKVSVEPSVAPLLERVEDLVDFYSLGRFRAGYLEREKEKDIALLPGEPAVVLEIAPRCARDRLIRILSQLNM